MNAKKILPIIIICFYAYGSAAIAGKKDQTYLGIHYAFGTFSTDIYPSADFNPGAIIFRLGGYATDNLALEFRIGSGGGSETSDTTNVLGISVETEIGLIYGVYGLIDMGTKVSAYGLIGLTRGEASATALGIKVSDRDTGLSLGAGINFGALNIELTQYLSKDDYDFLAVSVGVTF